MPRADNAGGRGGGELEGHEHHGFSEVAIEDDADRMKKMLAELCADVRHLCGRGGGAATKKPGVFGCLVGCCFGVVISLLIWGTLFVLRDCADEPAAHSADSAADLGAAIAFLQPRVDGSALVVPLAEMHTHAGTVLVKTAQMLAIAGSAAATQPSATTPLSGAPRLWARFDVNGMLFMTGVSMRDQTIAPDSYDDPQGAAAQVKSGGLLVATATSFLNLRTTVTAGAVRVNGGGVAEFYGCLFDGCQATNGKYINVTNARVQNRTDLDKSNLERFMFCQATPTIA